MKEYLKDFRLKANMSQEEISEKLFISRSAVSKIENGKQEISLEIFRKWAIVTNCEIQATAILFGTDIFSQIASMTTLMPMIIKLGGFLI